MDKPMIYYLKELIPDDAACEKTRAALGLDGIYSLVSTDDWQIPDIPAKSV